MTDLPRKSCWKVCLAASLLIVILGLSACQSQRVSGGTPGPLVATVHVTEKNFNIHLEPNVVPPGAVKFIVENQGPDQHEFILIRSDLPPDELPYDRFYQRVKEDSVQIPFNQDRFPPSQTVNTILTLDAGQYIVICNLAGHYIKGMHTALTVTDQAAPTQTAAVQETRRAATPTPVQTTTPSDQ